VANSFNHVSVIGLGYVGLPTAAVIANRGINVTGVDISAETTEAINRGETHIVEPDLDILVRSAVSAGNLRAVAAPQPAEAYIIAVPTPLGEGNTPDLSHLEKAAQDLAPVLEKGNLIILESTSPVGTTEKLAEWLQAARPELKFPIADSEALDIHIAYSPERVLPGRVLIELVDNDRVIGGLTDACSARAALLYKQFVKGECLITTARTAELVKLAENAYRDTNIAFANELSLIGEAVDVDVWEVIELANRHPRVDILKPGPGVGGHCIAIDPWFIVDSAPELAPLIKAARGVNDGKPRHIATHVAASLDESDATPIACLGLAYKADIDDLRESPAVDVVRELSALTNRRLLLVEPHIEKLPPELAAIQTAQLCDLETALSQAGAVILLTDHSAFKTIENLDGADKVLFDTRGMWR
jgi:UDP-N-acetyl-D-mannosaminuronic acid dehydrogenase|tara:strand:- start:295 stop:1545 length:1251 start_codon:yes stop_codon:yes gene_type:complete